MINQIQAALKEAARNEVCSSIRHEARCELRGFNHALHVIKQQEPVAWQFELARRMTPAGEYTDWYSCVREYKPNVPSRSIRNLRPLYAL